MEQTIWCKFVHKNQFSVSWTNWGMNWNLGSPYGTVHWFNSWTNSSIHLVNSSVNSFLVWIGLKRARRMLREVHLTRSCPCLSDPDAETRTTWSSMSRDETRWSSVFKETRTFKQCLGQMKISHKFNGAFNYWCEHLFWAIIHKFEKARPERFCDAKNLHAAQN